LKSGKRIRFFRNLRGMTQKELGKATGLSVRSAGVRVAQYETAARTPKRALLERFADALGVSADALALPNLDTPVGLMHTLFALEDLYGLEIAPEGAGFVLRLRTRPESGGIWPALAEWNRRRAAMDAGRCARKAYDQWRYCFQADTKGG